MIENNVGKTCPYCQTLIKPGAPVRTCETCDIPHHAECWEANGGCTTYGCSGGSGEVRQPSAGPSVAPHARRSAPVLAIVLLVVSIFATLFTVQQSRQAAIQRRIAEQAQIQAQHEREEAEKARRQAELERKRATPVILSEAGVTVKEPSLDAEIASYSGLGYPRPRFWIYAVLDNNLHGVEDQTVKYEYALRGPYGLDTFGPEEETISSTEEHYLLAVRYFMKDGSSRPPGDYQYAIRVNGEVMAEGSFSIP